MSSPAEGGGGSPARLSKGDPLSKQLQVRLPSVLARAYPTEASGNEFLAAIGFPPERIPLFRGDAQAFWNEILNTVPSGDLWAFIHRTSEATGARKEVVDELDDLLKLLDGGRPESVEAAERPAPGCHAIVWTASDRVREAARQWLLQEGLDPRLIWANAEMTSFGLNEANASIVTSVIRRQRPQLLFKVIGPDEADYLIDQVTVIGRDERAFPMRNVPAQLTLDDLASSAARLHPAAGSTTSGRIRNAVRHGADGRTSRVSPSRTLLQSGFQAGDRVSIAAVRFAPIRVLLIGSSPADPAHGEPGGRGFGDEADCIRQQAKRGGVLVVGEYPHAQVGDVDEIVECRPDIIHLSCPDQDRALLFEDATGGPRPVQAEWLVNRLADQALYYGLKLSAIVLNAGSGELVAPILSEAASTVIAHRTAIPAPSAILFAERFYRELSRLPIVSAAAQLAAAPIHDGDGDAGAVGGNLVILPQSPQLARGVPDHATESDLAGRGA
jgi:Effector-associated domain 1